MRLHVLCCAVLIVCLSMSATAGLLNASFEDPDFPGNRTSDRAAHWGRWGDWFNRETGWTPTHSGSCLLGYHHWKIEGSSSSGVYQDVGDVPQGLECTFTLNVFVDRDTNAEAIDLCIEPFGGGEPIACKRWGMDDLAFGKWHEISVKGTNPTKGLRALIVVRPFPGHHRQALSSSTTPR